MEAEIIQIIQQYFHDAIIQFNCITPQLNKLIIKIPNWKTGLIYKENLQYITDDKEFINTLHKVLLGYKDWMKKYG